MIINKKYKRGFWTGVLAVIMAIIARVVTSICIGFLIGMVCVSADVPIPMTLIKVIDSSVVGFIFIIVFSNYAYNYLTKEK